MNNKEYKANEPMEELKQFARIFEGAGVLSGLVVLADLTEDFFPKKTGQIVRLSLCAASALWVLVGTRSVKDRESGNVNKTLSEDEKKLFRALTVGDVVALNAGLVCNTAHIVLLFLSEFTDWDAPAGLMAALRVLPWAGISQLSLSTGISLRRYGKVMEELVEQYGMEPEEVIRCLFEQRGKGEPEGPNS